MVPEGFQRQTISQQNTANPGQREDRGAKTAIKILSASLATLTTNSSWLQRETRATGAKQALSFFCKRSGENMNEQQESGRGGSPHFLPEYITCNCLCSA
jgi:hypothetical protein